MDGGAANTIKDGTVNAQEVAVYVEFHFILFSFLFFSFFCLFTAKQKKMTNQKTAFMLKFILFVCLILRIATVNCLMCEAMLKYKKNET